MLLDSSAFYRSLQAIDDFSQLMDQRYYRAVPGDWWVLVSDVESSTKAIDEGRYREVNLIGAASIACVQNVLPRQDFAFVFGGDGATLLIHESKLSQVREELLKLSQRALRNYSLGLRVGGVRVSELKGSDLLVARYRVCQGQDVAFLKGDGVDQAERLVKESREHRFEAGGELDSPNTSGLSCRWKPMPSRRGRCVSLLIQSRVGPRVYREFLKALSDKVPSLEAVNPLHSQEKSYKSIVECFREDLKNSPGLFSQEFLKNAWESVLASLLFRMGLRPELALPYVESLAQHSDYRKFDNVLRMVLDLNTTEQDFLSEYLSEAFRKAELFYGLHSSQESLMTCLVSSLEEGEHLHFVDGGGGGYAMAAKQLKAQLHSAKRAA